MKKKETVESWLSGIDQAFAHVEEAEDISFQMWEAMGKWAIPELNLARKVIKIYRDAIEEGEIRHVESRVKKVIAESRRDAFEMQN
jgi:hypothetical protein